MEKALFKTGKYIKNVITHDFTENSCEIQRGILV